MGILRFSIPDQAQYDSRFWEVAYVAGALEGIPKPSRNVLVDGILSVDYEGEDTCRFSVPWPTKDYGPIVLTTASLKGTTVPYVLDLELARGTIHRIRSRAFDWEHARGLRLPAAYSDLMEQALESFVQAVVEQGGGNGGSKYSQAAIDKSIEASRSLARAYTTQTLQVRATPEEKLQTLFGVHLPTVPHWMQFAQELRPACNAVSIDLGIHRIPAGANRLPENDPVFEQLEWAKQNELKVVGGPLVSMQTGKTPSFANSATNFEQLCRLIFARVGNIVEQCQGRVRLWDASSSLNISQQYELDDQQAFRLASGIISTIRSIDKSPIVFCINQPAAEYMKKANHSIDPFRFARSLIQVHDRDIAGIGLDLNLHYWPHGTLPRDLIEISDLIDQWQFLEKSLLVRLTAPLSVDDDNRALFNDSLVSNWRYPGSQIKTQMLDAMQDTDPDLFGTHIEDHDSSQSFSRSKTLPPNGLELIQMLLCKLSVHGIIWSQTDDSSDHLFPNSGLYASDATRRPLVECMNRIRQQYIV
jgi:hypothetical protein